MVNLYRYRTTSGERNFIEWIKASIFQGSSFSNRDNITAPIQFRGESQHQHLQRWYFLKSRPISGVTLLSEHSPSQASEIDYIEIFSRPQENELARQFFVKFNFLLSFLISWYSKYFVHVWRNISMSLCLYSSIYVFWRQNTPLQYVQNKTS